MECKGTSSPGFDFNTKSKPVKLLILPVFHVLIIMLEFSKSFIFKNHFATPQGRRIWLELYTVLIARVSINFKKSQKLGNNVYYSCPQISKEALPGMFLG